MLRQLAVVTVALTLGACSFERFIPDDVEAMVAETERLLAAGDAQGLRDLMPREAAAVVTDDQIAQVRQIFVDGGAVEEASWVGYSATSTATTTGTSNVTQIVRQLTFERGGVVVSQRLTRSEEGLLLLYLNVTPLTEEQIAGGTFSFEGKSPLHYGVFAAALALPLFSILTIIGVWRTRRLKRPMLWTLFCLLGLGTLTFDWSNGAFGTTIVQQTANGIELNILQVQLLSAAAWKQQYGPWILVLSFPLGALVFWIKRARGSLRLKEKPTPIS